MRASMAGCSLATFRSSISWRGSICDFMPSAIALGSGQVGSTTSRNACTAQLHIQKDEEIKTQSTEDQNSNTGKGTDLYMGEMLRNSVPISLCDIKKYGPKNTNVLLPAAVECASLASRLHLNAAVNTPVVFCSKRHT